MAVVGVLGSGCERERKVLQAALVSSRPEERAEAVKKFAAIARPEDFELFARAAQDPAVAVRREAVAALAGSADPKAVDLLGQLLADPSEEVKRHAAFALAKVNGEKAKGYLTAEFARGGGRVREVIVEALKSANVPGAMAGVVAAEANAIWERNLKALNGGSLPERVAAAEELGRSGRVEAVSRLLPLVKDSQVVLAAAAVRGLGFAGDRRVVGPISELLRENYPELREAASESLLRLQDPAALDKLKEVAIERSASSAVATAAVIALPVLPETNDALCEIALAAGSKEGYLSGRELRRRGGCPPEALARKLGAKGAGLGNLARAELEAVLIGLAGLGPTAIELGPAVARLLPQREGRLRGLAIGALAEMGDRSAAGAVLKVFEQAEKVLNDKRADWVATPPEGGSSGKAVNLEAIARQAELLKKVGDDRQRKAERAVRGAVVTLPPPELIDDLGEDEVAEFAACLRALGALGDEKALAKLEPYVEDPLAAFRGAAAVGLASLGDQGVSLARSRLLDPDRGVQGQVAEALAAQGATGQAAILGALGKVPGDRSALLQVLDGDKLPPAGDTVLLEIVREAGPDAPAAAAVLGRAGAEGAAEALLKYLAEESGPARKDVLLVLGKLRAPGAAALLGRELYRDNPELRAAAAQALVGLAGPKELEALDALKGDYYRKVRESAALGVAPNNPHAERAE